MKVMKKDALAFFAALGFSKATTWKPSKLKQKLALVPSKVEPSKVPEGFEDFYAKLCKAGTDIELVSEEKKAPAIESAEEPAKEKKAPAKAAKPAKADKPAKAAKPVKAAKTVERDSFGCRKGSIAARVNGTVGSDWKTEQEIAKEAGVALDQARGRLYYAAEQGIMEHRRLVQYRLKPKAKAA